MSRLRAKCPDCKTYTAVALGPEYECHSCGRGFDAGPVGNVQPWHDLLAQDIAAMTAAYDQKVSLLGWSLGGILAVK